MPETDKEKKKGLDVISSRVVVEHTKDYKLMTPAVSRQEKWITRGENRVRVMSFTMSSVQFIRGAQLPSLP